MHAGVTVDEVQTPLPGGVLVARGRPQPGRDRSQLLLVPLDRQAEDVRRQLPDGSDGHGSLQRPPAGTRRHEVAAARAPARLDQELFGCWHPMSVVRRRPRVTRSVAGCGQADRTGFPALCAVLHTTAGPEGHRAPRLSV